MRLTSGQLVLAAEAAAGGVLAAAGGLGATMAHSALVGAGAPAWAAALVWAPPAGALGHVARRFHALDEIRRWHGAAVRRVEAWADDEEDDSADEVDDAVVDEDAG